MEEGQWEHGEGAVGTYGGGQWEHMEEGQWEHGGGAVGTYGGGAVGTYGGGAVDPCTCTCM